MKTVFVLLLASFIAATAFGASLYGEKEDAVANVEKKFNEIEEAQKKVNEHIEKDKSIDENLETAQKNDAAKRRDKSAFELKNLKSRTIRTAIVKGKPASAIECIAKVDLEAQKLIPEVYTNFEKILSNFKENRINELNLLSEEVKLIYTESIALKDEDVKKINEAKGGYQSLVTEYQKKADNAIKQLSEIQKRVEQFNIKTDYSNLGKQNESKNKEVADSLTKRMQKCIA